MKRYSEYKDSGISWLGQIPSHWEEKRISALCFQRSVSNCSNEPLLSVFLGKGVVPFNSENSRRTNAITDDTDLSKYQLVEPGDFVLNNQQAWRGSVGVSFIRGIVSPAYIIVRFKDKINFHFANYSLQSRHMIGQFYVYSRGVGSIQRNIYWDSLKSCIFPIPPIDEQEAIVEYLDSKTSKIDTYIAEREKEISALQELKQAEIAHIVTHGLNPDVPMRDSGIPWLGQIPAHWDELKLSQVAKEHFISNKDVHHQNLLSLSYGKIVRRDINATEGLLPASFDTYQIVEPGNIVLRLTDLQNDQRSLRVGLAKEEGIVTSAYLALQVRDNIIPEYLYLYLHSADIHKYFYSLGSGIRQNLNFTGLRDILIAIPPIKEQKAIVDYINAKISKIDSLIADLTSQIEKLKEYKQRLIADVVTGQVDVRK